MEDIDYKKLNDLALSVMKVSRNTLVIHLRFMDSAISRLSWISLPEAIADQPVFLPLAGNALMTDGHSIAYDPVELCRLYGSEKEGGPRAYLHMVLHCVFRHFMVSPAVNQPLWNLACDMAVEGVINGLNIPPLMTQAAEQQKRILQEISPKLNGLLTAEKIYHYLQGAMLSQPQLDSLAHLFSKDTHDIWYWRMINPQLRLAAYKQSATIKQNSRSSQNGGSSGNPDKDSKSGGSSASSGKSSKGNGSSENQGKDSQSSDRSESQENNSQSNDSSGNSESSGSGARSDLEEL